MFNSFISVVFQCIVIDTAYCCRISSETPIRKITLCDPMGTMNSLNLTALCTIVSEEIVFVPVVNNASYRPIHILLIHMNTIQNAPRNKLKIMDLEISKFLHFFATQQVKWRLILYSISNAYYIFLMIFKALNSYKGRVFLPLFKRFVRNILS